MPFDFASTNARDRIEARRFELFALAAPVFRRLGYRGATLKSLAFACHLSPPALYHYFPSKLALATYHLTRPRLTWYTVPLRPAAEPLEDVRDSVDMAIAAWPDQRLTLDLAREAGVRLSDSKRAERFAEGVWFIGRAVLGVAPSLGRERAEAIARHVLALLVAPDTTGLDADPAAVRARIVDALRLELVPGAVDASRFATRHGARAPSHGRRRRVIFE